MNRDNVRHIRPNTRLKDAGKKHTTAVIRLDAHKEDTVELTPTAIASDRRDTLYVCAVILVGFAAVFYMGDQVSVWLHRFAALIVRLSGG